MFGFLGLRIFLKDTKRTRVMVFDEKQENVLMVKTWISDQSWKLLGGGMNKSETPVECAIREVREECGIELKETQLKHVIDTKENEKSFEYEAIYFRAKVKKDIQLKMRKIELIGLKWLPVDALPGDVDGYSRERVLTEVKFK